MKHRLAFLSIAVLAVVGAVRCTSDNPAFSAGLPCSSGGTQCEGGTVCDAVSRTCVCPEGSTLCGQSCVDVDTNALHCGGCGLDCPAGDTCSAGRCSSGACAGNAIECGGQCVDPQTNAQHCGGCRNGGGGGGGQRCGDGEVCIAGSCQSPDCPFGETRCGARCVELTSDPDNCGECGRACGAGTVCSEGNCRADCAPGLAECGGACVDLARDRDNCGRCGVVCDRKEICAREKDGQQPRCRDYRIAGCNKCPCEACGDRSCCVLAGAQGGFVALCVEGRCPGGAN